MPSVLAKAALERREGLVSSARKARAGGQRRAVRAANRHACTKEQQIGLGVAKPPPSVHRFMHYSRVGHGKIAECAGRWVDVSRRPITVAFADRA
jgi:hypothetical protein